MTNKVFKRPLDVGIEHLSHAIDFNAVHNPNHSIFQWGINGEVVHIRWEQYSRAVYEVTRLVIRKFGTPKRDGEVIVILASLDFETYHAIIAGLIRANYTVFPISPRNSPAGVHHLVEKTQPRGVVITDDAGISSLVSTAIKWFNGQTDSVLRAPTYSELYLNPSLTEELPPVTTTTESPAIIIHSSGSTSAFPKPITFTLRTLLELGHYFSTYAGIQPSEHVLNCVLPAFHAMGAGTVGMTTFGGMMLSTFPPTLPPVIPTPSSVLESAIAGKSAILLVIPMFLEIWSHNPDDIEKLKSFDAVVFGGNPTPAHVGDKLWKEGVKLTVMYGSTETGGMSDCLPLEPGRDGWEYWEFSQHVDPVLVPYDESQRIYQLMLKKCPTHTPSVLNTTSEDGSPAYLMDDLVQRHPNNPKSFRVYGRADDQIGHTNGEKTNPIPIESTIRSSPFVEAAIMFGDRRFHAGVIIVPSPTHSVNSKDIEEVKKYKDLVWPLVVQANENAPAHSRIFKEMIILASSDKPIPYSTKGLPKRRLVHELYADEINTAYSNFEASNAEFGASERLTQEEYLVLVRSVVQEVIPNVGDQDDIFQAGCDSLQASYIRNSILKSSPTIHKDDLLNLVYTHPTIEGLAKFLARPGDSGVGDPKELMFALVRKYTQDLPRPIVRNAFYSTSEEVFLLTGSTGALGAHLLHRLLHMESVKRVYVLNRSGSTPTKMRQERAFSTLGLDSTGLSSSKLEYLDVNYIESKFGVGEAKYQELTESLTCIIHNGWDVNFNLSLSSMEPLLLGTRNLVNLALSSTRAPKFLFISSVGVFANSPGDAEETRITDPASAIGTGYSESKWCAEEIVHDANLKASLPLTVIRVGQLCGANMTGAWKINEWFPSLVRSSQVIGCFPELEGTLSWIPTDIVAQEVLDLRDSSFQYANLVHPSPVSASVITKTVSSELQLPRVSYDTWVKKLKESASEGDAQDNPALRLLNFFDAHGTTFIREKDNIRVDNTLNASAAVRSLKTKSLDQEDVRRWLGYWTSIGFLGKV